MLLERKPTQRAMMMTRERTFRELEMLFPDLCRGDNHILLNFTKAWRSGIIPVAI